MKKRVTILFLVSIFFPSSYLFSQSDSIDYFGQAAPGKTITEFAPGIISKSSTIDYYVSFSPDGKEMFYGTDNTIYHSEYIDDDWQNFTTFSAPEDYKSPVFSPTGNLIYLWEKKPEFKVGYMLKEDTIWTDVEEINLGGIAGHITATKDSCLYFIYKGVNICYSKFNGDIHKSPVKLPYPINDNPQFVPNDPCISPDGDYLLLVKDGIDKWYVSFKRSENQWTYPKQLSNYFLNPDGIGYLGLRPQISPDGKYIFTSNWNNQDDINIYWVSTDVIEAARTSNFKPYIDARIKIPDLTDSIGNSFNYTIADTLFNDNDGNETLTITAKEYGMDDLPGWLHFDDESFIFSGELTETGTFQIEVIATDTAGASISDIFRLTVKGPSSLQAHPNTKLTIYPNPTNGILQIDNADSFTKINFEIYSPTGQLLQSNVLTGNIIDLTNYSKGVYLLRLNTEDQTYIERILVE